MALSPVTQDSIIDDWLSIVDAVERAQRRMLNEVEQSGVSSATFQVLQLLLRSDEHRLPMSRLAKSLSMTGGGFTKLADRMARDGLIDRRHSSTDRRVVHAQLTVEGEKWAASSVKLFRESLLSTLLPSLAPDTVRALAEAMNALSDSLSSDIISGLEEAIYEVEATPRDPGLPDRRARERERERAGNASMRAGNASMRAEATPAS